MTLHLGNVPAGSTLYIPFATYNAAGASVTLTGLAVTDIEIYKNGSTTQRASDAGYALLDTDGIDFDSVTGIHGFSVDLSDNTTSGFFSVGGFYWVVVASVTIDSQTVNFIAATFRIVAAESSAGVPKVDVSHFGGVAGTFASGRPEVNTTLIEGSDATNQIRDSVVDDATRIDASALNTLSSHDPGETIMGATDLGTGSGLTALASQSSVDDLPTNAELATALGTADDAVLAAVAALNDLSAADVRDAVGLASANLDTQLAALPTAAENATELLATDIEADWTLKDHFRISAAALYGKTFGYGTGTVIHRDVNDAVDRIEATAEDGNRSAVTLDASDP